MAIMKWFGKNPTTDEIDAKAGEVEARRLQKVQAQAEIDQSIQDLKDKIQDTLAAAMLDDDPALGTRRKAFREQMLELRRRRDDLDEELAALTPLQTMLASEKTEALVRVTLSNYDRKSASLLALSKDIEPLIVSLGEKLRKAAPIVADLSAMTPNSEYHRQGDVWINAIRAFMARNFDGSNVPGVLRKIDVNDQILAQVTALTENVESHLTRLREAVSKAPPQE